MAGLVLAVVGGAAWGLFLRPEPEPVYQGKPLREWLEAYSRTPPIKSAEQIYAADAALREIGTNAIPTFLRYLRAKDSPLTLKLLGLAQRQHFIKIHHTPAKDRNWQGTRGLIALGSEANGAVPALLKIFDENISPESRYFTVRSLWRIGPAAEPGVPQLLTALTDTNRAIEKDLDLRTMSMKALGDMHAQPEVVVPVLMRELHDSDLLYRSTAAESLGKYGTNAVPALEDLFGLLTDEYTVVRLYAVNAIRQIDPEAAALRKAELDAALPPALR